MTRINAHDVEFAIKGDYTIEVYRMDDDGEWYYTGSYRWEFDNSYSSGDADWYELEQEVRDSNLVRFEQVDYTDTFRFYID